MSHSDSGVTPPNNDAAKKPLHSGIFFLVILTTFAGCGADGSGRGDRTLGEFFGAVPVAKEREFFREAQLRIGKCMKGKGFSFVPFAPSQVSDVEPPLQGHVGEWRRLHGYGYAEGFAKARLNVDPNAVSAGRLRPDKRAEYDAAMFGSDGTRNVTDDPATFGCDVDGNVGDVEFRPVVARMYQKMNDADRTVFGDLRVIGARAAWAKCMAEHGYSKLESPSDVLFIVLNAKQQEVQLAEVFEGWGSTRWKQVLAAFRRDELKVAAIDAGCSEELWSVTDGVRAEVESKLISANREVLRQMRQIQDGFLVRSK
jgi:hypothetical protein